MANDKKPKMKVIEPTKVAENHFKAQGEKLRVAAYARVSSETDEQENSFENQREYFKWLIEGNPHYIFAGLYADEGITGTSTKNRYGFQEMMDDALDGKVDLILVKSISRFGRNTLDTLNACRALKNAGIDVFFEKENIHILDQAGELLLTIFSSLAQEESRSISENVKLGIRSGYKRGSFTIVHSKYVGYDRLPNSKLVINADAWIVRYVYLLFHEGHSFSSIAAILNKEGIEKPTLSPHWCREAVATVLTNEKYCGDVLLQKGYVKDYLDHKVFKNDGVLPQYYIYDDHEAIIPRDFFYYTINQYERRKELGRFCPGSLNETVSIGNKITCTNCNMGFGHKTGHSNDKYRFEFYRCNGFYKGLNCESTTIRKEVLQNMYLDVLNEMNGDDYLKILDLLISSIAPQKLYTKAQRKAEKIKEHEHTIEVTPSEATEFLKSIKKKKDKLETEYQRLMEKYEYARELSGKLEKVRCDGILKREFDLTNFNILLDEILVDHYRIIFMFKDGRKFVRDYDPALARDIKIVYKSGKKKYKKIKRNHVCWNCSKEFPTYSKNCAFFCSQKCKDEYIKKLKKQKHPPASPEEYVNKFEYTCVVCGRKYYRHYKSPVIKYCSRECQRIDKFGYIPFVEDDKNDK